LGVRDVAARDAPGLLLVEALRELDPLAEVRTARVERAHGARELADLEEELHGERAESGAREPSLRDPEPERMAAEGATGVDHRAEILDEGAAAGHRLTSTPQCGVVSTPCTQRHSRGIGLAWPKGSSCRDSDDRPWP